MTDWRHQPEPQERCEYKLGVSGDGTAFFRPAHDRECWIVINGVAERVWTQDYDGTATHTITLAGVDSGAHPAHNVIHYLYASNHLVSALPRTVRPSTVAPTAGYLGTTGGPRNWRHIGWYACCEGVNVAAGFTPQTQVWDALHREGARWLSAAQDAAVQNTVIGNFETVFSMRYLLPPRCRLETEGVIRCVSTNGVASDFAAHVEPAGGGGALANLNTWNAQDDYESSPATAGVSTTPVGRREFTYDADIPGIAVLYAQALASGGVANDHTYQNGYLRLRVFQP